MNTKNSGRSTRTPRAKENSSKSWTRQMLDKHTAPKEAPRG